jgi:hypothetical protein
MNETIWLDSTGLDDIHHINEFCKSSFGIIQSTSKYPYLKNWMDMLTDLNFKCESITRLNEVRDDIGSEFKFPYVLLSFTFTTMGKIKSALIPSMRKQKKNYIKKTRKIFPDNKQLMEGIIIKAINKK